MDSRRAEWRQETQCQASQLDVWVRRANTAWLHNWAMGAAQCLEHHRDTQTITHRDSQRERLCSFSEPLKPPHQQGTHQEEYQQTLFVRRHETQEFHLGQCIYLRWDLINPRLIDPQSGEAVRDDLTIFLPPHPECCGSRLIPPSLL